jgi:hypothetical protein
MRGAWMDIKSGALASGRPGLEETRGGVDGGERTLAPFPQPFPNERPAGGAMVSSAVLIGLGSEIILGCVTDWSPHRDARDMSPVTSRADGVESFGRPWPIVGSVRPVSDKR